jgi:DNA-binding NarL/FixJ family response regulator
MTTPTRVLIVDDHALVREMLTDRIADEPDMIVIGQAGSGDEAIELAEICPDVVLLDIDMPGISAFDAARSIARACPGVRVVFLSAFIQDGYIAEALDVEASGYLSKTTSPTKLVGAIRTVAGGGTAMSAEVLDRLVLTAPDEHQTRTAGSRRSLLTQREREVVALIAQGLQQKQVATRMGISIKTVQTHLAHAMDKLGIHDRVDLTRWAIREGVIVSP